MINGNLGAFIDALFTGQDLEVLFRGRHYFIHGHYENIGEANQFAHLEMFDYDHMKGYDDHVWSNDGPHLSYLASEFLQARIWDGMTFDEAEREIEWI